jgi:hypothetical protein
MRQMHLNNYYFFFDIQGYITKNGKCVSKTESNLGKKNN